MRAQIVDALFAPSATLLRQIKTECDRFWYAGHTGLSGIELLSDRDPPSEERAFAWISSLVRDSVIVATREGLKPGSGDFRDLLTARFQELLSIGPETAGNYHDLLLSRQVEIAGERIPVLFAVARDPGLHPPPLDLPPGPAEHAEDTTASAIEEYRLFRGLPPGVK